MVEYEALDRTTRRKPCLEPVVVSRHVEKMPSSVNEEAMRLVAIRIFLKTRTNKFVCAVGESPRIPPCFSVVLVGGVLIDKSPAVAGVLSVIKRPMNPARRYCLSILQVMAAVKAAAPDQARRSVDLLGCDALAIGDPHWHSGSTVCVTSLGLSESRTNSVGIFCKMFSVGRWALAAWLVIETDRTPDSLAPTLTPPGTHELNRSSLTLVGGPGGRDELFLSKPTCNLHSTQ